MDLTPNDTTVPANHLHRLRLRSVGERAELFLDDAPVGTVTVSGADGSWGFGRFRPGPAFAPFAAAYRTWSALLHAGARLTAETSVELARIENRLDRIKGRLFFPADGAWVEVVQLNIDGDLLEWKEY